MIAREGRMAHRNGRQVRRPVGKRLDARLFVIGDDRDRRSLPVLSLRRLFQLLDLAIDAQDFGHLLVEIGIAAFEIAAHLVRLDLLSGQYLAQGSLGETG